MDAASTFFISLVTCNIGFLTEPVAASCGPYPNLIATNETAEQGTVLFNNTKSESDNVTFDIQHSGNHSASLKEFFMLNVTGQIWELQINQTLDLELIEERYNINLFLNPLTLIFQCGNQKIGVNIDPVNEFTPTLAALQTSIPENTTLGSEIFGLKRNVTDKDLEREQTFFFTVVPYNDYQLDGKDYFGLTSATGGSITVKKVLDYDTPATKTFYLNVSVADAQGDTAKTSYSVMTVTVTDVDDQVPYFVYPNCPTPCLIPQYTVIVRLDDKGPLKLEPVDIKANDKDTLGTARTFAIIQRGHAGNIFIIDSSQGNITQTQSIRDSGLTDEEFRLVIEVRKVTSAKLAANAVLVIKVKERISNCTNVDCSETTESITSTSKDLLIPMIVLGVLFAIAVGAIIVFVLIMRKKQMLRMVRPTNDKSDPQTEEEELHTDEDYYNTKVDFNAKNYNSNEFINSWPETNGSVSPLPPLRKQDTSTETTEGKKKKRNRKRKKTKEREVFDGTKEYNMGVDPEFFDSTDKSKVKRSNRSYSKNMDPALWIKVPNDNISTNEFLYTP